MRVIITGASGFIGSHTIRALLAANHEVMALVYPDDLLQRLNDLTGQFDVITTDLANIDDFLNSFKKWEPDACIHLAWYTEPGKYLDSPENIKVLISSLAFLQGLVEIGCKQIVGAGTCAEYDLDAGYFHEDSPISPKTLYAVTKSSLSFIGHQLAIDNDINFAWARIFYLFGPQEDKRRLIPSVVRSLKNGNPFPSTAGEQIRDYLHVEDIARAFVTIIEEKADGIYNISSGTPITIRTLLERVGKILGKSDLLQFGALPYREWEPMFICGDNRKLRSLGWAPKYSLEQGLEQTCEWWMNQL